MRRPVEEAFEALRQQIMAWSRGEAHIDVRVFVYPPEWEPVVLARFPPFAEECRATGSSIELVDVGQGLLAEIKQRPGLQEALTNLESENVEALRHNLSVIATRYLQRVIREGTKDQLVCRLLVNTGALATVVSYSAITNDLAGGSASARRISVPCVLAFPGEGDDRFLNLLGLRADTNYRTPRI